MDTAVVSSDQFADFQGGKSIGNQYAGFIQLPSILLGGKCTPKLFKITA